MTSKNTTPVTPHQGMAMHYCLYPDDAYGNGYRFKKIEAKHTLYWEVFSIYKNLCVKVDVFQDRTIRKCFEKELFTRSEFDLKLLSSDMKESDIYTIQKTKMDDFYKAIGMLKTY